MIIFHQAKDGADKNLIDADLVIGQVAETLGTTSPGDGGAHTYLVEGPRAADESTDYTLANGNVAARVSSSGGGGGYDPLGTLAVTVGGGGDYATLTAAIEALSARGVKYTHDVTINILTGTTISEQLVFDGVNLGWITITSDDATVTWDATGLNATHVLITVQGGGVAPVFDIELNVTGTVLPTGVLCTGAGSAFTMMPSRGITGLEETLVAGSGGAVVAKNCAFSNPSGNGAQTLCWAYEGGYLNIYGSTLVSGEFFVQAFSGAVAICDLCGLTSVFGGKGRGFLSAGGGVISADNAEIVDCIAPVEARTGGLVQGDSMSITNIGDPAEACLDAFDGGRINAKGVTFSGTFSQVARAEDGSHINCPTSAGGTAGGVAYQVTFGATIVAGAGTTSQTPNTLGVHGIIYQ